MSQPSLAGNTTQTSAAVPTHYPALDGLRAVAFLMVFATHYGHVPWGFAGVNFFFVLSGFLITGILYDTKDRPDRARRFYVRRALRIFPLYYGVMLAVALLEPVMHWDWYWPWIAWPLYLGNLLRLWGSGVNTVALRTVAYAQLPSSVHPHTILYFGHFWSLCVEEQFYLFWPWVVFWVRSRERLLAVCLAAVLLCPVMRSLADKHLPAWTSKMEMTAVVGVPFQLDALLLGALLALLWRSRYREIVQKLATVGLGLMTLSAMAYWAHVLMTYPLGRVCDLYTYPDWRTSWDLSLLNLYGAALMICALRPGSLTYRCLNPAMLRYVGRISYGAYVFHDIFHAPLLFWIGRVPGIAGLAPPLIATTAVVSIFGITLALASLSYYAFEMPFLRLKERWAPARKDEWNAQELQQKAA